MDRDADFSAYVDARWPQLVRAARLLGCGQHDAEDLVQTALTRCYVSWARVSKSENRDAYVYRVLVNCLSTSRRRRWWGETPTAELPEDRPSDSLGVDDRLAVVDALTQLSEDHRVAVVLRYYADLSEADAAAALGIPAGTLKSRTARALARLGEILDPASDLQSGRGEK